MSDRVGVISHHTMMIAGSYRCATAFMTDIRYFVGDKGFIESFMRSETLVIG